VAALNVGGDDASEKKSRPMQHASGLDKGIHDELYVSPIQMNAPNLVQFRNRHRSVDAPYPKIPALAKSPCSLLASTSLSEQHRGGLELNRTQCCRYRKSSCGATMPKHGQRAALLNSNAIPVLPNGLREVV
jgi:hypothetical protein